MFLRDYVVKVDQDAIAGIHAKLERAHEHFSVLHHEMLVWTQQPRPWLLVPEVHDQGRKHFLRLHLLEPIPVMWSAILGEAIHDLRSALEQCVYWLTIDYGGRPLKDTGFPVNSKRKEFELWSKSKKTWAPQSGMHKIRGVGPGPQAFIERLQPYPQRWSRDYVFAVRALHNVWNQDKHRLVHLFGLRFSGDAQLRLNSRVAPYCVPYVDQRIRHENAIVFTIICDPPHAHVQVGAGSNIPWTVAFSGGRRRGGGSFSLWDIEGFCTDIANKLLWAIGRQNETINVTIWTAPWRPVALL